LQRRTNPVLAFLYFGFGQPDNGKAGQPVGNVNLHRDEWRLYARDGAAV